MASRRRPWTIRENTSISPGTRRRWRSSAGRRLNPREPSPNAAQPLSEGISAKEASMSDDTTLNGPDLSSGIAESDLADDAMLAGHASGEAVLLARSGGEVFAIGATCTHYSGPLAEGLIVGATVRCPWHHACFSLRTGEALAAPAFNPVACWRVERSGGRVFVREKVSAPAKPRNVGNTSERM